MRSRQATAPERSRARKRFSTALAASAAAALVACGGGGGGGETPPPDVPTDLALSGKVMDGYLQGATVCFDANANLRCDAGELSATTGADGGYRLTVPADKIAGLSGLRFIADVPATAIDAASGLAVGEDHVLLTQPFDVQVQSYHFTPLGTYAEQAVLGGATRADAQTEARRAAGLVQLGLYDDYVAAGNGPRAAEATRARAQASTWFANQTRLLMETLANPSPAAFEDRTQGGGYRLNLSTSAGALLGSVSVDDFGVADAEGNREETRPVWRYDGSGGSPVFQGNGAARDDFLDEQAGWLTDPTPQGRTYRLVGSRAVEYRNGLAIASEARNVLDLQGLPIQQQPFVGTADVQPGFVYPVGARRFSAVVSVQLRTGGFADPLVVTDPQGRQLTSFDEFISIHQAANGGVWWTLTTLNFASSLVPELTFDGTQRALLRDHFTQNPIGTATVARTTFAGRTILRLSLADNASNALFGFPGGTFDFTDFRGVRQLLISRAGEVGATSQARLINRAAATAIFQALGAPPPR